MTGHLARAELLAGKGETASAKDQLANAIRVLGDQGELEQALRELRVSL